MSERVIASGPELGPDLGPLPGPLPAPEAEQGDAVAGALDAVWPSVVTRVSSGAAPQDRGVLQVARPLG